MPSFKLKYAIIYILILIKGHKMYEFCNDFDAFSMDPIGSPDKV